MEERAGFVPVIKECMRGKQTGPRVIFNVTGKRMWLMREKGLSLLLDSKWWERERVAQSTGQDFVSVVFFCVVAGMFNHLFCKEKRIKKRYYKSIRMGLNENP